MSKIRALFLGTPDFSAKILKGLLEDEHYEIVGVVTQPDKPRGRELKLLPCPTKEVATQNRLTCLSPAKINALESIRAISDLRAEVAIVVAYGQILSVEFLNLFNFGAVNIHGSELPKWRGPAPVQRSIEAGETQTAVTLQKIVKELDAGDIIGIRFLTVNEQDSALDVLNKMTPLSLELLKIDLMDYIRGNLAPQPQNHKLATFAPKILKSETQIDWSLPATAIHNKVRAYLLGPGAWTQSPFGRIKILKTKVSFVHLSGSPGQVSLKDDSILVSTGNGTLELIEVHPESKKKQSAKDWWNTIKAQKINLVQFQKMKEPL